MENIDPRSIDKESREKIKNNIDENYFVEAGAGSGKTTVLVERMVKMIEEDRDISHICAITFTKAAANEFYERFQKKLIEKSLENNEYKQKYLNALQNIDLAFMGTIDSFCNMIMSEHPRAGFIPSSSKVISQDEAEELYKREYANIQNGLYNDTELEAMARKFIQYDQKPQETFIYTLNTLLNHRDCELVIPEYSKESIDERFKDEIKTIRMITKILCDHPEYITSSNDENAQKVKDSFDRYRSTINHSWEENVPYILNALKKTFQDSNFRLYPSKEVEDALGYGIDYFEMHYTRNKPSWYVLNENKLPGIIQEINEIKYGVTLQFVNKAKKMICERLRKEGALTFSDYLIYLRDTLRKDASNEGKLIKHIYQRHRYFLIDEFQDTDPIQAEIFFYLAAREIKPEWRDCIPHKGSLFIVGDPKQSIYRFKNADVASYLKVEEMFKQPVGEVLYLFRNFRSTYEVRDWFNKTFSALLTSSEEQAQFEEIPIDELEKMSGFSGVYKYDVPFKPQDDSQKDEYLVTDMILKLHNNESFMISEKRKTENGFESYQRKLEWKDFMLITPTKGTLAKYTRLFRQHGIPCYVEGNIVFSESKAFETLVSLYGAVSNPNDNRYLYKILKSRLFNIKAKSINEARNNGFEFDIFGDIETVEMDEELKKALYTLKDYAKKAKILSPSSLFNELINSSKVFRNEGNENMEYVYFALELIKDKLSSKEIVTHADTLSFLETLLYEKNDQERCPGLEKDGNQVHLANLHKVKGLEAPVVIMASSKKRERKPEFRMVRTKDGNKGYLFAVKKKSENGDFDLINTAIFDTPYKEDEAASNKAEELRLEYVAATRARNVLILSNLYTKDGPSKSSYWYDLLTCDSSKELRDIDELLYMEKAVSNIKETVNYEDIEVVNNVIEENNVTLSASSVELANPSKTVSNDTYEDADTDEKVQKHIDENNGETLATITGTMVHRLMELIIMSKDRLSLDKCTNTIIEECLVDDFMDQKDYFVSLMESVYKTIHNGGYPQNGKVKQDILPVLLNADKVYSEVPFTYLTEDHKLWNGIIDLIYVKDEKIHIIDWKTNKSGVGLDEHYKEQLKAYSSSVSKLLGKDVEDAYIYHIGIKG